MKSDFRSESFIRKLITILFEYILLICVQFMIGCSKKNREDYLLKAV